MAVIPTSLITDGVLNAEGCNIINAGNVESSGASRPASLGLPSVDMSSTPGSVTINAPMGVVTLQAGHSTLTVTNSVYNILDGVFLQVVGPAPDATARSFSVNASASGAFDIVANANATVPVSIIFLVVNANPPLA